MEDKIVMSKEELNRSALCQRVISSEILLTEAGELMSVSYRQAKRIIASFRQNGAVGLIHGNRGKESNRKITDKLQKKVLNLYSTKYSDFKPTFFTEKLTENHKITISSETVRKLLIKNNLWQGKRARGSKNCHVWRAPKAHKGEMIQFDGSHHRWLENRLDQEICLMAYIDDATNEVFAKFYEYEGTFPVLDSFQELIKKKGIPKSLYTDKHSTYKTTRQTTVEEQLRDSFAETQFERVMKDIGVEVIFAHSPQAKGRVERLFYTLQDRLVKELRLANICTIKDANVFLRKYLPKYNQKFAKDACSKTVYYRVVPKGFDYKWTFSIKDQRVIANDFTIRWRNRMFLVQNQLITMKKQQVQVKQALNGDLRFETKNKILQIKEITEKDYHLAKKQQKETVKILSQKDNKKSKKSWMDDFYIGNPKVELVA